MKRMLHRLASPILTAAIAAGAIGAGAAEKEPPLYRRAVELKIPAKGPTPTLEKVLAQINNIAISPDGRWLAATGSASYRQVFIFDITTRKLARTLLMSTSGNGALSFLRDSRHILASPAVLPKDANTIAAGVWDIETGQEVAQLLLPEKDHPGLVAQRFAVSRNGNHVAMLVRHVEVYETKNWTRIASTSGIPDKDWKSRYAHGKPPAATKFGFALDGDRLVIGGTDGAFRVWNFKTGQIERVVDAFKHLASVKELAVSPDGRRAAATGAAAYFADNRLVSYGSWLKVFDLVTGELLAASDQREGTISSLAYSPDGKYVFLTGGTEKKKYNHIVRTTDASIAMEFDPPRFLERSSAFSEDGKYLAIGGQQSILICERVERQGNSKPNVTGR